MKINGSNSRCHCWAAILAGGDGKRLLPLTRRIAGDDRPKQFCAIIGKETLLQQTQRRISRLVPRRRTLLVLTRTHESFYADHIAGMRSPRSIIQPCNQGTAPAVLYTVMRLCELDSEGIVAFFPSDHYFSNDETFISHIDSAYTAAASNPKMVVLLGITPETPEVEYGWIEPGALLESPVSDSLSRVRCFWEKPDATLASALMKRGCLWNSFVMVGHVRAFMKIIRQGLPNLVEAFESIRPFFSAASETAALCDLYAGIRATSFSQDVLSMCPHDLAVLRGTGLGWSDLGKPSRVLSILERKGVQTAWEFTPIENDGRVLVRGEAAG
jgi:mannose-1-phosphate guanylyltransferase